MPNAFQRMSWWSVMLTELQDKDDGLHCPDSSWTTVHLLASAAPLMCLVLLQNPTMTWTPLVVLLEFSTDIRYIIQKQSPVCEVDQSYASHCAPYSQGWDPWSGDGYILCTDQFIDHRDWIIFTPGVYILHAVSSQSPLQIKPSAHAQRAFSGHWKNKSPTNCIIWSLMSANIYSWFCRIMRE